MAIQNNWRMCSLCMGIFFGGHQTKGICPFELNLPGLGGQHKIDPTIHLQLTKAAPKTQNSQDKWRWCHKCEGLFFHGNKSDGRCPAGGLHSGSFSEDYQIQFAATASKKVVVGGSLAEILWCFKCEGMYVNFGANFGSCPGVGEHTRFSSGSYFIPPA
jgi:hypothetical protein